MPLKSITSIQMMENAFYAATITKRINDKNLTHNNWQQSSLVSLF